MREVFESVRGVRGDADLPTISIVVIGRNEGARLAKCLDSIRQVRGVPIREIIYVDSASTDGSPVLAARYGAIVIVVRPERPTAAIGRNAGWRRADSDLVLFLDGDTVLHPGFPRAASEALSREPSVAAVWGHRREIHPARAQGNFLQRGDEILRGGVHIIPKRMLSKINVSVQQLQRQQRDADKFPHEITAQADDH